MKKILFLYFLLNINLIFAQTNTDVYLVDITTIDSEITLTNLKNISNNEGYDNQPSFYGDHTVLFPSSRNGQTDIVKYDISSGQISWVSDTPVGSEYSPLRIPNSDNISAVRLDTAGFQRLYKYDSNTSTSELIRKDAKVGYHIWYSENILISTILVENRMDLVLSNFKDDTNLTVAKNVGRSLHKIPNTDLISYLTHEEGVTLLNTLNPITAETAVLQGMPKDVRDMCWLNDGRLLFPMGKSIVSVHPESEEGPAVLHMFKEAEINQISRMAVSPDGKHLALVSEELSSKIVQKQVDAYNAGNLDAFVNCYAENVIVQNFPTDTLYLGHEKMRKNYSSLSSEKKIYHVEVVKRITIGNKVIDHEKVTGNGKIQMQVALYEVNNSAISSMTFIFDNGEAANPETIVQKQLDAYNNRDIEGFLKTYSEGVALYNFPAEKTSEGQKQMRKGYAGYFESTPDLHGEIRNRIVIGNKVIDEEYITSNGTNFYAVVIYEVENDKISKVTFVK